MDEATRRQYLGLTGAVALAGLAGCGGQEGEPTDAPTDTPTTTGAGGDTRTTATAGDTTPPTATDRPVTGTDATTTDTRGSTPVVWRAPFESAIAVRPVVEDGRVYAGTESGVVGCHDVTSGGRRWSFDAGGPVAELAVADGTLLVVTGTSELESAQTLHAIDAATGTERWTATPSGWWLDVVGAADGTVYFGTEDDAIAPDGERFFAVSVADGREEWSAAVGDVGEGVVTDEAVFVTSAGRLYAYDRADGTTRWERPVTAPAFSTLAVSGATVVYASEGDGGDVSAGLVGVDAATGTERWRYEEWRVTSTAVADGVVYAGGAKVGAFDPADGSVLWVDDATGFLTDASVTTGRVYAGGDGARALDRESGDVEWSWTPEPTQGGVLAAGVTGDAVLFDSYRDGDPRNRYKFEVGAADGSQRWAFENGTELTDLAVGDSVAVVGGADGVLYGLG